MLMPDQKCWGATYIEYMEKCRSGTYILRRDKHVHGKYGKLIWYVWVWWNVRKRKIFMMGGDKGDGA